MNCPFGENCIVVESENRGRIVIAKRAFVPSELVSKETCVSFALSHTYNDVGCTYCSHLCVNETIFGSANSSRYCSNVRLFATD